MPSAQQVPGVHEDVCPPPKSSAHTIANNAPATTMQTGHHQTQGHGLEPTQLWTHTAHTTTTTHTYTHYTHTARTQHSLTQHVHKYTKCTITHTSHITHTTRTRYSALDLHTALPARGSYWHPLLSRGLEGTHSVYRVSAVHKTVYRVPSCSQSFQVRGVYYPKED